jgi:hypothetical protein
MIQELARETAVAKLNEIYSGQVPALPLPRTSSGLVGGKVYECRPCRSGRRSGRTAIVPE